jgi:flagella basal body P-ring formation protein FlgA
MIRRVLILTAAMAAVALPAFAGPVSLIPDPVDEDGRVTLGDLFDGAGAAADVLVARRVGPSIVLDAGAVQGVARRAGLQWANETGLRRIVVRQGASAPSAGAVASPTAERGAMVEVLTYARSLAAGDTIQPEDVIWSQMQAHQAPGGSPQDADDVIGLTARRALRAGTAVASRDLTSPQVIARNDMVTVAFNAGGVRLTILGRAQRNAAAGEPVAVLNLQSGRLIDAIATGPGQAAAGPAARSQQLAAR